jgi:predicted dehydrogenase
MAKYNALIVGCGNMGCLNDAPGSGNEHKTISYAKALKENGNFEIWAYDKSVDKERKAYAFWDTRTDICLEYDVIIIATPDDTHYYNLLALSLYSYKPKLVICEKPLCMTSVEVKEVIKFYEDRKIPILVDYTRRFIPEYQQLKAEHGKAVHGYCRFNRGMLHTGTHALDIFNYFGVPRQCMDIHEFMSEEILRFWALRILFEDGYVFREQRIGNDPVPARFDHHTRYVIDNAYNFLEGKEELKCTMYDGLKALELMEELI